MAQKTEEIPSAKGRAPLATSPSAKDSALRERVGALRLGGIEAGQGANARIAWSLCIALSGLCLWLGYLAMRTPDAKAARRAAAEIALASDRPAESAGKSGPTAVGPPTAEKASDLALQSKGYIIPVRQILVSPQVSGRLLRVHFTEGQQVKTGDVLAEIEPTEYRAEFLRTEALLQAAKQKLLEMERGNRPEEVAQVEAELGEAQAQLPEAEADWKRNQDLHKKGAIAEQEFVASESKYRSLLRRIDRLGFALKMSQEGPREEQVAVARAQVEQAEAERTRSRWRLDNCTVRSPISGTILKKNAEEGNIVNPVAFNGSFSLCEMADLAELEVEMNIQERDISRVFPGQRCEVRAEAWPERVYAGSVSRLMPIADRAKGAIPVRVKLTVPAEEEGAYLKPEMGALVTFLKENSPDKAR